MITVIVVGYLYILIKFLVLILINKPKDIAESKRVWVPVSFGLSVVQMFNYLQQRISDSKSSAVLKDNDYLKILTEEQETNKGAYSVLGKNSPKEEFMSLTGDSSSMAYAACLKLEFRMKLLDPNFDEKTFKPPEDKI